VKGADGDRAALEDMRRHAARVRSYSIGGRASLDDEMTRDAVLYALAIIGEAANRTSEQLRAAHPEVPWRRIVNQRNILVHVYDQLDLDLVWQAIELLPGLETDIDSILESLDK
jgi:uncharacterized protein with HEPN domain